MYDPETAALLRSAPEIPELDPADLPQVLTEQYAQIVSIRLGGEAVSDGTNDWTLDRIADIYELVVSATNDPLIRRPSAFVAGSAQLLISRREELLEVDSGERANVSRDRLAPEISAALLFLSAEQYADAHEAASKINIGLAEPTSLVTVVTNHIVDLAKGQLSGIVDRGNDRVTWEYSQDHRIEIEAFNAMLHTLASGIEKLASIILGLADINEELDVPRAIFEKIRTLATSRDGDPLAYGVEYVYPGIFHLASLLIAANDGLAESSLTDLKAPDESSIEFWGKWINFRASKFPYIWPNHRKALAEEFHHNGTSAVLVLPTGAGKTTISSIKIANVLAQGKKVIFLAPTHALVEQLTVDLQEMFPEDLLGSSVSSDFDLLFQIGIALPEIEVMTPERCLAMLSFSPDSFDDVGLLVFDECHLLSPQSAKIRRSLDSMLCLLAFSKVAPKADYLFLSAMVKNGRELSEWIEQLTSRNCISVDLLWKPSRQARGIVIYSQQEIDAIENAALAVQTQLDEQSDRPAKNLRASAARRLIAQPHAIWGLQHNWLDLDNSEVVCSFTKLMEAVVPLTAKIRKSRLAIRPNVNKVAARIAAISAENKVKTIVFVNQKSHAISTARDISNAIGLNIESTDEENLRWTALELELGGLEHSLLTRGSIAVPHNASMLRIERELSERMYKRVDGAMVIVATPTLAQGLNLPAQMAILASDKRAEVDKGGRELLEAHELLNAAARAGRAGHLANGIVLLIPEPLLIYEESQNLNHEVVEKLQSLMPEDDRCVELSDPLSIVLDSISSGNTVDRDVLYLVNRLATLKNVDSDENTLFDMSSSFAAFQSRSRNEEEIFNVQLDDLEHLVQLEASEDFDEALSILASQSGLPPLVLSRLKQSIEQQIGSLPTSIYEWVIWLVNWLNTDIETRDLMLYDVKSSILGATGRNKKRDLTDDVMNDLIPGIYSWISGVPIKDVEIALGGDPDSNTATSRSCPRARELIGSVLPRGLSFVLGLITRVVTDVDPYDQQEDLSSDVVDALSAAIRLGYDTPDKLNFSFQNPSILSRVEVHATFSAT